MNYIFANWKMYLDFEEAEELMSSLAREKFDDEKVSVSIFPNTINFTQATKFFADSSVSIGAQNVNWTPQGAYTGAISAHLFGQAGARYALVGHSERRHIFGESDEDTRQKVEACFDAGIIPVLCVGETKKDLEAGKKEYRLKKQLKKVFEGLKLSGDQKVIVAYEPVWAIGGSGDGKPCTPDDASEAHSFIRSVAKECTDKEFPILYGGSVKTGNVLSYIKRELIDGVLVGSASTKYEEFVNLVRAVENISLG
jgi:triosephosphate isomerase (TIM)